MDFVFKGTCFLYQAVFDEAFAKFRPAHCLLGRRIERSIAEGVTACDFLCGDVPYKREYFPNGRTEFSLWLFPRTPRGLARATQFGGRKLLGAIKRGLRSSVARGSH